MKQMPDKYFELAIVDPPYGIGESGSKNHSRGKLAKAKKYKDFYGNDLLPPDEEYFNQLFRISKHQIIWGANHFIDKFAKGSSCWIVWDKDNGGSDFADCELAWTSFNTAVRKFKYKWNGMLQENMKNKEFRIHSTQKPVALYEWLLNNYAKKGDKILDTHLGSASSIIACKKLGFEYMGFEIDKYYFDKASERIAKFESQTNLFEILNKQPKTKQESLF
jgi:site-specific DNA-methyltransferase (adenine-specific)